MVAGSIITIRLPQNTKIKSVERGNENSSLQLGHLIMLPFPDFARILKVILRLLHDGHFCLIPNICYGLDPSSDSLTKTPAFLTPLSNKFSARP